MRVRPGGYDSWESLLFQQLPVAHSSSGLLVWRPGIVALVVLIIRDPLL